ncbi:hypothetical protein LCGC14_0587990 [marine sediment metagenome]|uniref:Uncharacterized protein n=1 Tax=marine sediment metagenome TaxID=412755 RepID=A0A0F9U0N8_9ZZZZ
MPWIYRITEIKTEPKTGGGYVKVHLWRTSAAAASGDPPDIVNEHIMNLKPVRQRAVTDERGHTLRQSGKWAAPEARADPDDPPVKENANVDVGAQIRANIERFIDRAQQLGFADMDMSDPSFAPTNADPHGVLARPDVTALKNKNIEHDPNIGIAP